MLFSSPWMNSGPSCTGHGASPSNCAQPYEGVQALLKVGLAPCPRDEAKTINAGARVPARQSSSGARGWKAVAMA